MSLDKKIIGRKDIGLKDVDEVTLDEVMSDEKSVHAEKHVLVGPGVMAADQTRCLGGYADGL